MAIVFRMRGLVPRTFEGLIVSVFTGGRLPCYGTHFCSYSKVPSSGASGLRIGHLEPIFRNNVLRLWIALFRWHGSSCRATIQLPIRQAAMT